MEMKSEKDLSVKELVALLVLKIVITLYKYHLIKYGFNEVLASSFNLPEIRYVHVFVISVIIGILKLDTRTDRTMSSLRKKFVLYKFEEGLVAFHFSELLAMLTLHGLLYYVINSLL